MDGIWVFQKQMAAFCFFLWGCECPLAAGASAHLPLCWRPTKKQRVNYPGKIGFHHKPSQTIMYHLHSSAMIKGIELQILIHLILTVTDY